MGLAVKDEVISFGNNVTKRNNIYPLQISSKIKAISKQLVSLAPVRLVLVVRPIEMIFIAVCVICRSFNLGVCRALECLLVMVFQLELLN